KDGFDAKILPRLVAELPHIGERIGELQPIGYIDKVVVPQTENQFTLNRPGVRRNILITQAEAPFQLLVFVMDEEVAGTDYGCRTQVYILELGGLQFGLAVSEKILAEV